MRSLLAAAALGLAMTSPGHAIVGGAVVRSSDEARRWTVKVESSRGELCSGVPLQPRIVLTAAHCVIGGGAFRVAALDERMRRRTIAVRAVTAHESFLIGRTPSTQPGIDLAMLLLAEPLPASLQPVTLGGAFGMGDRLTISGFGLGQEGRRQSARTLRQSRLMAAGAYTSSNSVVVAVDIDGLGQAAGAGACKGDSGGPIMRGDGRTGELLGIVSWSSGPTNQRTRRVCGGFTAITPVADHAGWIASTASALAALPDEAARAPAAGPRQRGGRSNAPAAVPPAAEPWMRQDSNR